MSARLCKSLGLLLILSLLLAACQPIQPTEPAAAEGGAVPPPGWVERTFPTAGLTFSLPERWAFRWEPGEPTVVNFSPGPFSNPQARVGMWPYLMEEPAAAIILHTVPVMGSKNPDLAELLRLRFRTGNTSEGVINPVSETTVVEEPTLLTVNGQPAAKMVVEGIDVALQKPFRVHAYAIRNGDRVVYISSALLEENEAAFAPLVDQVVQTVTVSEPQELEPQPLEVTGEIASGQTRHGALRLSPSDRVVRDYWHFTGEAGKRYVATARLYDDTNDIMLDIVDSAGVSQFGGEIDDHGDGEAETGGFTARQDGDYYVAVRAWFLDDGAYELKLEQIEQQ